MGKPIVNTCCCCCCELETGGKIIAWIGMIIYGFFMGAFAIGGITLAFIPCEYELQEFDLCKLGVAALVIILLVIAGLFGLLFYVKLLLLQACNEHSPGKVLPILILSGIGLGLSSVSIIFELLNFSMRFVIMALIFALDIYIFIVLLSLRTKFNEERRQRVYVTQYTSPVQFGHPGMVGQPMIQCAI